MKALIYKSVATDGLSLEQIEQMLVKARMYNNSVGITGMLLYSNGDFVQYLEGDDATIDVLYEKIEQDTRHYKSVLLFESVIEKRMFKDFDMSFQHISATQMNPLLAKKDSLLLMLLQQFSPNNHK